MATIKIKSLTIPYLIADDVVIKYGEDISIDLDIVDKHVLANIRYLHNVGSIELTDEDRAALNSAIYKVLHLLPNSEGDSSVVSPEILNGLATTASVDEKISGVNTTITTNVNSINASIETINTNVASNTTSINTVKSDITSVKKDLGSVSTDVKTLQTDVTSVKEDIETVKTDVTSNTSSITSVVSDVASTKTDINSLKTDSNTAKSDIASIKTNVNTVETDVTSIKSSISSLSTSSISEGSNLYFTDDRVGKSKIDISVTGTDEVISSSDTLEGMIVKLQAQINALKK